MLSLHRAPRALPDVVAVVLAAALAAVLAAACGPAPRPVRPREPQGYAARMAEAEAHDRDAAAHERASRETGALTDPSTVTCGNPAVGAAADQTTSGGERIGTWVPCWSTERQANERHHQEARRLRAEAREDRAIARNLVAVEREFCAFMPPGELTHTPFWHREDIASVDPYVEEGAVHGARIRFKPVEGLSAAWLRQAILCHQARASTLGHDPAYLAYDPSLLVGVHVAVTERRGQVEALVRADDPEVAAVITARAFGLLQRPVAPPPAPPAPPTH